MGSSMVVAVRPASEPSRSDQLDSVRRASGKRCNRGVCLPVASCSAAGPARSTRERVERKAVGIVRGEAVDGNRNVWSLVARLQGPLRHLPTRACVALDQTNTPAPVSPPVRSRQRSEALSLKIIAWRPATAMAITPTPAKKKSGARRMLMKGSSAHRTRSDIAYYFTCGTPVPMATENCTLVPER